MNRAKRRDEQPNARRQPKSCVPRRNEKRRKGPSGRSESSSPAMTILTRLIRLCLCYLFTTLLQIFVKNMLLFYKMLTLHLFFIYVVLILYVYLISFTYRQNIQDNKLYINKLLYYVLSVDKWFRFSKNHRKRENDIGQSRSQSPSRRVIRL